MKTRSGKLCSALLALALVFILTLGALPATPLAAYIEYIPFQVILHPVGATYRLNEVPVPLKATFAYDANMGMGYVDPISPIAVKWYWSYDNSNASRANPLGGEAVGFNSVISHTTTQIPTTDALGVKYYYAVLTYAERPADSVSSDPVIPREAVTDPARIEVIPDPRGFKVKKTDEDGNLLSGAIIALDPAEDGDPAAKSYTATTSGGYATFAPEDGFYVLSEKQAPEGYTGSEDKYNIIVSANGVYFYAPGAPITTPYDTVTFINIKNPAPKPPEQKPPGALQSFLVKKTDAEGKPLAGAIIRLAGKTDDGTPRVYDVTTDSAGEAKFTVESGSYDLSEWAAPAGYNASDDKYKIAVTSTGVYIDKATGRAPYATVVFINKKIPQLNKDEHFAYMVGYPDGTFGQNRNMTRAEAVVMFSRLLIEKMGVSKDYRANYYPDVEYNKASVDDPWYANQVCYMHSLGVLADFSRDSKFRPNEPVTRAEFATLAAHFDNLTLTDVNIFTDVPATHWAVKYINSAVAKKWIAGYPDKTFRPEAFITRAEVVTLVNRILKRTADKDYVTAKFSSLPRTFTDIDATHWAYWEVMEAANGHDFTLVSGIEKWTRAYK